MNNPMLFDCELDKYLDDDVHEQIEEALFEIMKSAFKAGWNSAQKQDKIAEEKQQEEAIPLNA